MVTQCSAITIIIVMLGFPQHLILYNSNHRITQKPNYQSPIAKQILTNLSASQQSPLHVRCNYCKCKHCIVQYRTDLHHTNVTSTASYRYPSYGIVVAKASIVKRCHETISIVQTLQVQYRERSPSYGIPSYKNSIIRSTVSDSASDSVSDSVNVGVSDTVSDLRYGQASPVSDPRYSQASPISNLRSTISNSIYNSLYKSAISPYHVISTIPVIISSYHVISTIPVIASQYCLISTISTIACCRMNYQSPQEIRVF